MQQRFRERRADKIGMERLGVDPELVSQLIEVMVSRSARDAKGDPTPAGCA